jgi:glycerophosphoryl diester phosphodiesterase
MNRRNFIKTSSVALAGISLTNSLAGDIVDDEKLFIKHFNSPDELARFTRLDSLTQPLLMAHRAGYSPQGGWPECAIESAEKVIRTGPAMIEIDVRTCADGELVCIHDWKLDRGTTGTGPVSEANSNLIAQLYLKDALGNVTDYHVPSLDDFLEWGNNGALLWLDLKDVSPELAVAKIRSHHGEARVIVSAYGLEMVKAYQKLAAELVYFIPLNERMGLPDLDSVLKAGVNPNNMIGFAGWYVPNIKAVVDMTELNIPALLDLSSADKILKPSQLDKRLYQNAFKEGFPMMNTDQYEKVLMLLGIDDWS